MTTFISYSRVHSAFVVRLAKDLKSAGFDVWLDQLDIPKGARWDDEIEAAVDRSTTFMIVLAPESIESQNVKDELSFAIDSGKHLLPVVIKPCKIPLRLRRFQYVDFTDKPYKDSLADIKRLLGNTRQLPKVTEEQPSYEPEEVFPGRFEPPFFQVEPASEIQSPPIKKHQPENVNLPRRLIAPLILAIIAIAAIVGAVVFAAEKNVPAPATFTLNPPMTTLTNTNTSVPPSLQIIDEYDVTMRLVSAGDFTMGSDRADEKPVQTLYLDTFYIDKYEVTNLLYKKCVDAGVCEPPAKGSSSTHPDYYEDTEFGNYPVVNVDWNMAKSYCEWRGARLPTEPEWEKAARGTDGRMYPWGGDISCNEANFFGCQDDTAAVTSYSSGLSVYGVYNLAGNVAEWVSTLYMAYPYDLTDGREDPNAPGERVLRGGSWLNSDSDTEARSAHRQMADPLTSDENIGFRCALSAVIPQTGLVLTEITPLNSFTSTSLAATKRSDKDNESSDKNSTATATLPSGVTAGPATVTEEPPTQTPESDPPTPEPDPPTPEPDPPTPEPDPPTPEPDPPTPEPDPPTPEPDPPTNEPQPTDPAVAPTEPPGTGG